MARRSYLIILLLSALSFETHTGRTKNQAMLRDSVGCSHIYGEPAISDCYQIISSLADGWPGEWPNKEQHLFRFAENFEMSGPGLDKPSVEASTNPVDLVKVARIGK